MSNSTALAGDLAAIVGSRYVTTRASALIPYESDALPGYRKRPSLAVFPGTRDEALAVIRRFARDGVPFVARGAGTGLSGGALADGVALLGLQRLRRIIEVNADARYATVEPGVVNATLTAAAAPYGLHYAPDPSSQTACTIGGNVAENSGGPHCLKYGVTLNHVLGATVALPDGSVVALETPSGPERGYDLLGAFVGSEGCFGVALDVTVRLTPNPESIRTLLADFVSIEGAARSTSAIVASGIVPAACELMDHGTIAAVEASIYAAGYPADAAAVLLVEVDGAVDSVEDEAARVEAICRANGARSVRIASDDPVGRARLWQGRKKAFGAMGRVAPHLFVQDAVVPRTQLAEILAAISGIAARHDVRVCNVFHAGDGNLHPNIPYNGRDPDERSRVYRAMREIMDMCIARGGTITGEHGVGLDKLPYMERLFSADTLDAMCRLRSAFDPDRRANPGKVVPVHSCREWTSNSAQVAPVATSPGAAASPAPDRVTQHLIDAINEARATGVLVYAIGARAHEPEPPAGATLADVHEHADVIEYIPDDLTITVGAGMTLAELDAVTAAHGQWCPLLPWGTDICTIGGVLAVAARGPASATLGAPRDLTLGLTFVDGRAAVVTAGGRVVKNVAGFDLTRAMIGSWGSLGVITAASLRLRARPVAQEAWAVPDRSGAGALKAFLRGPFAPVACETVPAEVASSLGLDATPHTILWIAGNAAHVRASRTALARIDDAREIDFAAWTTLRRNGPFTASAHTRRNGSAHAVATMSDELRALNERVRRALDPSNVFASRMMASADLAEAVTDG